MTHEEWGRQLSETLGQNRGMYRPHRHFVDRIATLLGHEELRYAEATFRPRGDHLDGGAVIFTDTLVAVASAEGVSHVGESARGATNSTVTVTVRSRSALRAVSMTPDPDGDLNGDEAWTMPGGYWPVRARLALRYSDEDSDVVVGAGDDFGDFLPGLLGDLNKR